MGGIQVAFCLECVIFVLPVAASVNKSECASGYAAIASSFRSCNKNNTLLLLNAITCNFFGDNYAGTGCIR